MPIYDGRGLDTNNEFNFTADHFDDIRSLPLYEGGKMDVRDYSVVSVGYAVNTYGYNGNDAPKGSLALSLNILFVVLLGVAELSTQPG